MSITQTKPLAGRRMLIATVPHGGYVDLLTGLGKHLQAQGCDVRWYTGLADADRVRQLGIPYLPLDEATGFDSNWFADAITRARATHDPSEPMSPELIRFFEERASDCYRDLTRIHDTFPFELLLTDSLFTASPLVKDGLHVPVAALSMVSQADERIDALTGEPGLAPIRDRYFDKIGQQADLFLQTGTPTFDNPRQNRRDNVRFVGALLPYSIAIQQPWHDERLHHYDRVVFVAGDMGGPDTLALLEPTLSAFQHSSDTLVIATTGGQGTAELRATFSASNLIIDDFLPFQNVLAHADVYISTGGYKGMRLALNQHVPLVVVGLHTPKHEINALVYYLQLGVELKTNTPTSEALREAVEQVLTEASYARNVARLASDLETVDSLQLSTEFLAELLVDEPSRIG